MYDLSVKITVKTRSDELVARLISDKLTAIEVFAIKPEDIKPGSNIGTAAMPPHAP